jgi:alkanesulfonate monooxygenase SsuD/methylene tetrahydromethanopterin reductase-like flavin-dependent oxidoreductase (luciferase family)
MTESSTSPMKFGFAIPIFANPGIAHFRTPNFERLEWPPIADAVREAEALGYDSLWVADHMFLGRDGAILEGWTTLCVLAGLTTRMRLGSIHLGNGFRSAPLVAKMAATLDFVSGGRFELFIDPGWREREHVAYGFDWEPDRSVRVAQLGEAVDLIKATWSGQPTDVQGRFYELAGAINTPTPVQPDGPRVWIGEAFDEPTLDLIATHADVWNSMPAGLEVLREKLERVDQACVDRDRDPSSLVKTLETQVLVLDHPSDLDRWLERWDALQSANPPGDAMTDVMAFVLETNPLLQKGMVADDYRNEFVIGTVDEVIDRLRAYGSMGIDEVMCWFMDFPELTSMRRLATDVRPNV